MRQPGCPTRTSQPPVTAAAGDPFTTARVLRLVACLERGRPTRIDDIAAALNARHLDWAFSGPVVADVLVQLQSNWMADYRNGSGIVVEDGPYGSTLDDRGLAPGSTPGSSGRSSARLPPVGVALADFSRRDGSGFDD